MDAEILKTAAQLTSTAVALVVALVVTFRNESRNQARFQQQLELSKRIPEANIRPLLALTVSGYLERKAMELVNHGAGTAVITAISFRRGKRSAGNVVDLLDLGREVIWNDYTELDGAIEYLPPKSSDVLVELTLDRLLEDMNEEEAGSLMETFESQLDQVKVSVTYQDVLGNTIAEDEELT